MSSDRARARDLGIPLSGQPGLYNSITDVPGVEVGHTTLVWGEGRLEVGKGPVRTGVTAVLPRGRNDSRMVFGGSFALNASGEMTGLSWLDERGFLEGPVMITNTHSVGVVRDATIQWMLNHGWEGEFAIPVVGETYDGRLNDINGHHVKREHAWSALDSARPGSVEEGNVGGGTGMMCYEFKGGIGTSSRRLDAGDGGYTVGVLVQANYGQRQLLRIAGVPVGYLLPDGLPCYPEGAARPENARYPVCSARPAQDVARHDREDGSIIVIVATDAPLLPHQLRRLAKRPALAIGRLGGIAAESSGDIFTAFSTANAEAAAREAYRGPPDASSDARATRPIDVKLHPNAALTPLFDAVVNATEEAILNSMVAAERCSGANGLVVSALPHEKVRALLAEHNLLVARSSPKA